MIFHQNHPQQLNGNNMKLIFLKMFCLFISLGMSWVSLSQNKVRFGYHDPSGNVKKIKKSEMNNEEENKDKIILRNNVFSNDRQDTITISVLLPLYTSKNELLTKYLIENNKDTNEIYKQSQLGISFLEGILLAVDSLSAMGIPVIINIFDTEKNIDTVRKIALSDEVRSSHIIFGPIYLENFNLVRNFFSGHSNKILINPLSSRLDLLKNSQNVFFLTPPEMVTRDTIISFLNKSKEDLLIITYEEEASKTVSLLKRVLSLDSVDLNIHNFQDLKYSRNTCSSLFPSDNVRILVMNEDRSFVNRFISFCSTIDTSISIIGFESWIDISELNIETLMKLNVHLPVSNYLDYNLLRNQDLFKKFEHKFYHKMNKNSYLAFRSILHFCSDTPQFSFSNLISGDGYVNTDVKMSIYDDYRLIPVK